MASVTILLCVMLGPCLAMSQNKLGSRIGSLPITVEDVKVEQVIQQQHISDFSNLKIKLQQQLTQQQQLISDFSNLKSMLQQQLQQQQQLLEEFSSLTSSQQEQITYLLERLNQTVSEQVGLNLALNKPANQSSTWQDDDASRAVDGNRDMDFAHGSCSVTHGDVKAWWQVDLGDVYELERVVITRRNYPGLETRLANFKIETSVNRRSTNSDLINPRLCFYEPNTHPIGTTKSYPCRPGAVGRYVRIQLQLDDFLTLCEVEVFGQRVVT